MYRAVDAGYRHHDAAGRVVSEVPAHHAPAPLHRVRLDARVGRGDLGGRQLDVLGRPVEAIARDVPSSIGKPLNMGAGVPRVAPFQPEFDASEDVRAPPQVAANLRRRVSGPIETAIPAIARRPRGQRVPEPARLNRALCRGMQKGRERGPLGEAPCRVVRPRRAPPGCVCRLVLRHRPRWNHLRG